MFELKYYGAIIETIHQGAYDICTPVDTDKLYKMAEKVKKAGRSYRGWCAALLGRCKALETKLLGGFKNYRYIEQLIVLAVLIEILEELHDWYEDTKVV